MKDNYTYSLEKSGPDDGLFTYTWTIASKVTPCLRSPFSLPGANIPRHGLHRSGPRRGLFYARGHDIFVHFAEYCKNI